MLDNKSWIDVSKILLLALLLWGFPLVFGFFEYRISGMSWFTSPVFILVELSGIFIDILLSTAIERLPGNNNIEGWSLESRILMITVRSINYFMAGTGIGFMLKIRQQTLNTFG